MTLRDGTEHVGHPLTNDRTRIAFQTDERRIVICKREIDDIDHGGDAAAFGGAALAAGGLALIVLSQVQHDNQTGDEAQNDMPVIFFGAGMVVGGGFIALPALNRWTEAREATGWPPEDDAVREPCSSWEELD